ncbi:unnamed protein product, partial [Didymodactylos carnosus]
VGHSRLTQHIQQSHVIRCDLQETIINPNNNINHNKFILYVEPFTKVYQSNYSSLSSLESIPIYQLKAINFIKQYGACVSLIYGMPLLVTATNCWKYDVNILNKNYLSFITLSDYLRKNNLMLICRLDYRYNTVEDQLCGYFLLTSASNSSLLLRSIASSELILAPNIENNDDKQEHEQDQTILHALKNVNIIQNHYSSNFFSNRKMAIRRLQQDLRNMLKNKVDGIDASPSPDNLFVWNAIICGPEDTIFENGVFKLQLLFPEDYPNRPPQVRFTSKLFHPNVWYDDGLICVDILKDEWTPSLDVLSILNSIRILLIDPNPLSPANLEAALLYRDDRTEYDRRITAMIQETLDDSDEEEDDEEEFDDDEETQRQKTQIIRNSLSE